MREQCDSELHIDNRRYLFSLASLSCTLLSDLTTSPAHTQRRHALASRITSPHPYLPTHHTYLPQIGFIPVHPSYYGLPPASRGPEASSFLPPSLLPASFLPPMPPPPCRRFHFHFLPCVSTYPRSSPSPQEGEGGGEEGEEGEGELRTLCT